MFIDNINNDGVDELLVQVVTAPMAGNIETIYTYNETENVLETMSKSAYEAWLSDVIGNAQSIKSSR